MTNWMEYLSNPRGHVLKKALFEVLKERYAQNQDVIDRLSVVLLTENDLKAFMKLIADVYEGAYIKAVNDHREQLEKAGLVAKIVPNQSRSN